MLLLNKLNGNFNQRTMQQNHQVYACKKKSNIATQQDEYVPLRKGRFMLGVCVCIYNTS